MDTAVPLSQTIVPLAVDFTCRVSDYEELVGVTHRRWCMGCKSFNDK